MILGACFAISKRSPLGMNSDFSHTVDGSSKFKFAGTGDGGKCPPFSNIEMTLHKIRMTTITVVIYMILSASSDDSWMPLILRHQKYRVITIAIPAE